MKIETCVENGKKVFYIHKTESVGITEFIGSTIVCANKSSIDFVKRVDEMISLIPKATCKKEKVVR